MYFQVLASIAALYMTTVSGLPFGWPASQGNLTIFKMQRIDLNVLN